MSNKWIWDSNALKLIKSCLIINEEIGIDTNKQMNFASSGGERSFLEAFFITFNLVANLTMAEMPNDLNNILTFFYILIFVTFGNSNFSVFNFKQTFAVYYE